MRLFPHRRDHRHTRLHDSEQRVLAPALTRLLDAGTHLLFSPSFRPWLVLASLQLADIITTALALTNRAAREGNATAAAIMRNYGQPAAYIIKAIGIGIVMYLLWRFRRSTWAKVVLYAAVAVTAITVSSNTVWLLAHT